MQPVPCGPVPDLCYRSTMPYKVQATRVWFAVALFSTALAACRFQHPQEAGSDNHANETTPRLPLPVVEAPFNRAQMLLAVVRAASSYAGGADDSRAQRALDGKQFEIALRFGCDGQGPTPKDHGWSVDPDGRTLRLRAVPTLSLEDELIRTVSGDKVEAAEGFWLTRPWMLDATCPAAPPPKARSKPQVTQPSSNEVGQADAPTSAPVRAGQRIGIAQFFTAEDSRTHRRMNRPFEAVKQLAEGQQVGQQGFNLVLSGRLRARRDGRVILCAGTVRDAPPNCVVSADIDRVRIEQPNDKAVMAEWSL